MQSHKVCILLAAIIAIGQHSCLADTITCTLTDKTTQACAEGVTTCFAKSDSSGTVTRGCGSDNCAAGSGCVTCTGNNCNAFLLCKQCYDVACGTTNAANLAYNQLCTAQGDVCNINLQSNGNVTRGCGAPCTDGDANCKSYTTDIGNVGIFPAGRKECYQCSAAECNTVAAAQLMPCPVYKTEGQKCYTIGSDAATMTRGCSTDAGTKCSDATPDANCVFCDNANGCNNQTYSTSLGSCIKCNDAAACFTLQDKSKATPCPNSPYTQTQNKCYTQMTNGVVSRGCVNELQGGQCVAANGCNECTGDACNLSAAEYTCLVCRSDNYADCRKAAVGAQACQNQTAPSQCFSGEWDGVVVRGCVNDLGSLMKYQCLNDHDDRCIVCSGNNCNTEVDKYNAAPSLQHLGLGVLSLLCLLRYIF